MFFALSTLWLAVLLFLIVTGAALGGLLVGRSLQKRHAEAQKSSGVKESSGVLQGALLGFMGLVLAFGLSLALGRYESRRADVVADANTIGTTYLRARRCPNRSAVGPWPCWRSTPMRRSGSPTSSRAVPPPPARVPTRRRCNGRCGPSPPEPCRTNPWPQRPVCTSTASTR